MSRIELHQFPYSHFNEKARWALDWKRQPHVRIDYLPGPHSRAIGKLSGQGQVPVLRIEGEVISGSARIIAALEERHPEPPLLPADPQQRARALEIQRHFDEAVGPLVRRALFSRMLDDLGYVAKVFAGRQPALKRLVYRSMLPLVKPLMRSSMGITDDASVEEAFAGTRAGLDFVAKEAGPAGYLVGDRFSVADLTAAALLAPACHPEFPAMRRPEPMPPGVSGFIEQWQGHPGAAWVLERYRRDRPDSAELPS